MKTLCVILTDYNSEKLKSTLPRVLNTVNFKPMLSYAVAAATEICGGDVVVYAVENTDLIYNAIDGGISCARLPEELKEYTDRAEVIMWLRGDVPCITGKELEALYDKYKAHEDISSSGVYFTSRTYEFKQITAHLNRAQNVCDSRARIAEADRAIRLRINNDYMNDGVTVINPGDTYIEQGVKIGCDTVIYPGAIIRGNTVIGENCVILGGCIIENCIAGNNVCIKNSTISDSKIGDNTTVGPYAYIRPGSEIGENVKIGDFVEVKKSVIGDGTKISHLTYVGDSKVGKNVNFGCGTVTVNYDGKNKFLTEIGDNVFIGCNTNLVSPVKVGDNAFIAAGSTITDEVPENSFAIARQRQTVKDNWVKPKDR